MTSVLYYCPTYTENWDDWTEIAYLDQRVEIVEQKISKVHQKMLLRYATTTQLQRARLNWFEKEEQVNLKSGRKGILFLHESCTLIPIKTREKEFAHDGVLGYFLYEQIAKISKDANGYAVLHFKNGQQFVTRQQYRSVREQYQLVKRWKDYFWQKLSVG